MANAREPLRSAEQSAAGAWGPAAPAVVNAWGTPPAVELQAGEEVESMTPMTVCQFLGAIGTILLALPAIIGAWCWPMVVAAIFNVGASVMNGGSGTGIVDFFHGLQVAIMLALMLNLVQFVYWTCKLRRTGSFWNVHSPTMMVLLSALMVNIQPMWILVIGSWKLCCAECTTLNLPANCSSTGMSYPLWSNSPDVRTCYSGGNVFWDISYCSGKQYSIFPTQWQGWLIQIVCTWGGYAIMFVGVFQATQLHKKLAGRWKAIRRGQSARS